MDAVVLGRGTAVVLLPPRRPCRRRPATRHHPAGADAPRPPRRAQANTLDDDWGLRQTEMEVQEESRRRKQYTATRKRRQELESAEVRLGFLVNQVKGWSSEFDRLQSFTGMETRFEPGESHIVDEITRQQAA